MIPFKQILVPIDFGVAMQPAIDLALALAEAAGAKVTLVHAFDVMPFTNVSPYAMQIDAEPILAGLERELKAVCERTRAKWRNVDAVIARGAPLDVILDTTKARECDLIVIGTHGRHGLSRALLGSVAERVVRSSLVPVLTVHPAPRTSNET
jgi:nucleotide-binding universal stress UspA family protein